MSSDKPPSNDRSDSFGNRVLHGVVGAATEAATGKIIQAVRSPDKRLLPLAILALQTVADTLGQINSAKAAEQGEKAPKAALLNEISPEDTLFAELLNFLKVAKHGLPPAIQEYRSSQPTHEEKARYDSIDQERSAQEALLEKTNKSYRYTKSESTSNNEVNAWLKDKEYSSGANVRAWWNDHAKDEFTRDSMGRPSLSWLKPQHLEALRGTDLLVGANLELFNFSGLDASGINLAGANIAGACMDGTRIILNKTNLTKALTLHTDFSKAIVQMDADLPRLYGDKANEILSAHPTAKLPAPQVEISEASSSPKLNPHAFSLIEDHAKPAALEESIPSAHYSEAVANLHEHHVPLPTLEPYEFRADYFAKQATPVAASSIPFSTPLITPQAALTPAQAIMQQGPRPLIIPSPAPSHALGLAATVTRGDVLGR